jgi:hypothetical protein
MMARPLSRAGHLRKERIMNPGLIAFTCVATFTVVSATARLAQADDAPAAKSVPATTAPVVSKQDVAAGDEVIRSTKSFLNLLRDSNDDAKAYEWMSAEFRKEHTADEFKQALESMRSGTTIPKVFSVSGDLTMKPADGGSPRATLRAMQSRGSLLTERVTRFAPSVRLTVSLVQEGGKWKVAALHGNAARDASFEIGKAPRVERRATGTLSVSSSVEGKLAKVNDDSIVLSIEGQNGAPATERTLKVDDQTAVTLAVEMDAGGLRGRPAPATPRQAIKSVSISRGSRSDIKADRHATVEMSDDLTRAESIMVIQGSDPNAPPEGL